MPEKYIKKILTSRVYEVAHETPLDYAPMLPGVRTTTSGKREDEQPVFSSGAAAPQQDGRLAGGAQKGVIAASAQPRSWRGARRRTARAP